MELIRTLREKHQTARQEEIHKMAEETICLSDFADSIYIAYAGTPLVPIHPEWTSKDIMQELSKLRQNYINSHLKQEGLV
jgi:hypothetical protein